MKDELRVYVALDPQGRPVPWTISPRRAETMERATETMMGYREYENLGTPGRRWAHCYRDGCRIVRATVSVEKK